MYCFLTFDITGLVVSVHRVIFRTEQNASETDSVDAFLHLHLRTKKIPVSGTVGFYSEYQTMDKVQKFGNSKLWVFGTEC
jgi:hypothetical protein